MRYLVRLTITIYLLLLSSVLLYGQGTKISQFTQAPSIPLNSFVQIVITNFDGLGNNTNFIIALSNLFNSGNLARTHVVKQEWTGTQVYRAGSGCVYYSDNADVPGQAKKASILLHQ